MALQRRTIRFAAAFGADLTLTLPVAASAQAPAGGPRLMRLTPGPNAGILPERGHCETGYERDAIDTQIRH